MSKTCLLILRQKCYYPAGGNKVRTGSSGPLELLSSPQQRGHSIVWSTDELILKLSNSRVVVRWWDLFCVIESSKSFPMLFATWLLCHASCIIWISPWKYCVMPLAHTNLPYSTSQLLALNNCLPGVRKDQTQAHLFSCLILMLLR